MIARRFIFLCGLLMGLMQFDTIRSFDEENYYLYAGTGSEKIGIPTLAFCVKDPLRASLSLVLCAVGGYIGYKLYKRKLQHDKEVIEQEIKKDYQKLWNAQWQKEMEKHQAKVNDSQEMTKCNVRIYEPGDIKETFEDVAGMDEAKEDLQDILEYLEDQESFEEIGAKIPKGILLSGPPGVGKTLLARALAGEADCPFLYINAAEFSEMYVGRGAARVRDLFEQAREHAPCILFIDEVDSVARSRDHLGGSSGDSEHAQTLNQLLSEMDGFELQEDPIIVIAATNRAHCLDPAILRPGRFDKKVEVELPLFTDRKKILNVHLGHVKHADIDVDVIARGTPGFSGAEIAQLVNEAALIARRKGDEAVEMKHIDESRDIIVLGGKEKTGVVEFTEEDYWTTAVHEAGHALMYVLEDDSPALYKVTIRPRGDALGVTHGMQVRETFSRTKANMLARICVSLGGSVAEELSYGGRATGISDDLKNARAIAKDMIMYYGMSQGYKDISFAEYIGREHALPPEISEMIHKEVKRIVDECRAHTVNVLKAHMDELHEVARRLMDKGTLFGSEVYQICGKEEPNLEYTFVSLPEN